MDAGCPAGAEQRKAQFFNQQGGLISLATTGKPLTVFYDQPNADACCALCASTPGCSAFNYCNLKPGDR
jgi:hypothetical protein